MSVAFVLHLFVLFGFMGHMFLVVRGASHQSYSARQPRRTMSQRDLLLNANTELSLSEEVPLRSSLLSFIQ